mmetsp:Transcript_3497/g.7264  ORF Transcript_3497/g.7264 Transcript_3497/m.7264 type:complete len:507 (-) Transcript_3497:221-1741(-)
MVDDTFQLTRVREDINPLNSTFDIYYSRSCSQINTKKFTPYSTFATLPPIVHTRSDEVVRPARNKSSTSFAMSTFEPIASVHTRTLTQMSTPAVTPNLVNELKANISKSFDYYIIKSPDVLTDSMTKLTKKESAQKHLRSLEAKMLELRRKKDSLEKERLLKEEKLASLLYSNQSLSNMNTQQDLVGRAEDYESKIASLFQDYSAEKFYTLVLEDMAKKRAINKKFCLIRNDKVKESLSEINHKIKESEKALLRDQVNTKFLKSQYLQMVADNQQTKKARKAEIKSVINSYREDLEVEHHISKNQESLEIMAKIRKNRSKLKLLKKVENKIIAQEKYSLSSSLHDSSQVVYENTLKKLQKATRAEDADSVVAMYNAILLTTNELVTKKQEAEVELENKRDLLVKLREERDYSYTHSDEEFKSTKFFLENKVERRTLELTGRELRLENKKQVVAQVMNGIYRLCMMASELWERGSSSQLAASTDFEGLCTRLGNVLTWVSYALALQQ